MQPRGCLWKRQLERGGRRREHRNVERRDEQQWQPVFGVVLLP